MIFPSRPAERRNWPSLRISKRRTSPRCALSLLFTWRISLNSLVSHTLMSLSLAPDMRMSPSSSNMRLTTSPRCPSMFACSPTLMLLSSARLLRCWSNESGVVSHEGRKWGGAQGGRFGYRRAYVAEAWGHRSTRRTCMSVLCFIVHVFSLKCGDLRSFSVPYLGRHGGHIP